MKVVLICLLLSLVIQNISCATQPQRRASKKAASPAKTTAPKTAPKKKESDSEDGETTTEGYNWRKNSSFTGVQFAEDNLGGIDDVISTLRKGPDPDVMAVLFAFLPKTEGAVGRSLKEMSNDAFIAFTNQRYQHCWNVSTEIPPDAYVDATRCALKHVKDGMEAVKTKLKEMAKAKDFLKDTVNRFKKCHEAHKKFQGQFKKPKRSIVTLGRSKRATFKQTIKKQKDRLIKYGTIISKHVGKRLEIVKTYVKESFKKMRTRMSSVAKTVFNQAKTKLKIVGKKTLRVAKLTIQFIETYYCYFDAALTTREEALKIAKSYGVQGVFDGLTPGLEINGTTVAEDFLDQFKVLTNVSDSVKSCVSKKLENYSQKLCSKGNVPHFSDPEDLEEKYQFETVDDDYGVHIEL